jgi:ABC-2 type transport system permease protein
MSVATTESDSEPTLDLTPAMGQRSGFGNLLRKELGQWWGTRQWWIQLLAWVVILNGVAALIMIDPESTANEAVQTFLLMGAFVIGVGVVLTVQGAVVGERESGTAAWIMSKPVSPSAFILAKLVAHSLGFLVTAVLVPTLVFAAEAAVLLSVPLSYGSLALGVVVVALAVVFYVALTLALGTLFRGRGPVAGIGVGMLLMGQFFAGMLPLALVIVTPWLLGDVATSVALGTELEFNGAIPVIATAVTTSALVLAALWRFAREEF